jgi:hypothetical protein
MGINSLKTFKSLRILLDIYRKFSLFKYSSKNLIQRGTVNFQTLNLVAIASGAYTKTKRNKKYADFSGI